MTTPTLTAGTARIAGRPASRPASPHVAAARFVPDRFAAGPSPADLLALTAADRDRHRDRARRAEADLFAAAAVVELTARVARARDLRAACQETADAVHRHLGAACVAAGTVEPNGRVRVRALSGTASVAAHAETTRAALAALTEAAGRRGVTVWPAAGTPGSSEETGVLPHAAAPLCHRQFAAHHGADAAAGVPLTVETPSANKSADVKGLADGPEPVAVLVAVGPDGVAGPAAVRFLAAAAGPLGAALAASRRMTGGLPRRAWRAAVSDRPSKSAAIVAGAALVAGAAMLLPVPHRVVAPCTAEPVLRRFGVAPHAGLLETSLVETGDTVAAGTVLGRMDGRTLRWELAGAEAERAEAAKTLDAARASADAPAAAKAGLAVRRLDLNVRTLRYRESRLEVRSPVAGVVLHAAPQKGGSLPVETGTPLYELAPLDPLRVEVAVPADEIPHLRAGLPTIVRFDGAGEVGAEIRRIRPRSEVRDARNVFVAEVEIPNPAGVLRPGQAGEATVVAGTARLGWVLFHRPAERVRGWLAP